MKKWNTFSFNLEKNKFILFFTLIILSLFFFIFLSDVLVRMAFLIIIAILITLAIQETFKKSEDRIKSEALRSAKGLFKIWFTLDFVFSLWIVGLIFVFYSLILLYLYKEIFILASITPEILSIVGQFLLAIGFLIFAIGIFGKNIYKRYELLYRILAIIGIMMSVLAIYFISLPFIYENEIIYQWVFYLSLLFGIGFLFLEEILKKNRFSIILLSLIFCGVIVVYVLDVKDIFNFFEFHGSLSESPYKTVLDYLDSIQTLVFIIFLLITSFFFLDYRELKLEKNKEKREIVIDIIKISLIVWICLNALYMILSL